MVKYRRRPVEVEAIRLIPQLEGGAPAIPGDWAILHPGCVEFISDEQFTVDYEPVGD